jgi:hypothetical protein
MNSNWVSEEISDKTVLVWRATYSLSSRNQRSGREFRQSFLVLSSPFQWIHNPEVKWTWRECEVREFSFMREQKKWMCEMRDRKSSSSSSRARARTLLLSLSRRDPETLHWTDRSPHTSAGIVLDADVRGCPLYFCCVCEKSAWQLQCVDQWLAATYRLVIWPVLWPTTFGYFSVGILSRPLLPLFPLFTKASY